MGWGEGGGGKCGEGARWVKKREGGSEGQDVRGERVSEVGGEGRGKGVVKKKHIKVGNKRRGMRTARHAL